MHSLLRDAKLPHQRPLRDASAITSTGEGILWFGTK